MATRLFPSATLAEFYRFALLLTGEGEVAGKLLAETLREAEASLGEMRHASARQAWLIQRLRERCLRENVGNHTAASALVRSAADEREPRENSKVEAVILAQRFSTLPEPQRSALALFYLELFDAEEIARLLKMETEELARTLADARTLLHDALHETAA